MKELLGQESDSGGEEVGLKVGNLRFEASVFSQKAEERKGWQATLMICPAFPIQCIVKMDWMEEATRLQ